VRQLDRTTNAFVLKNSQHLCTLATMNGEVMNQQPDANPGMNASIVVVAQKREWKKGLLPAGNPFMAELQAGTPAFAPASPSSATTTATATSPLGARTPLSISTTVSRWVDAAWPKARFVISSG